MDIPSRQQVILQQQLGHRIAAVFPMFYPRELFRAYGFHPVELWAPPAAIQPKLINEHFQPYTCAIARAGVAFLLAHNFANIDAILVPHTCDSLQGVGSVLRDFIKPAAPVLTLYHPRGGHSFDIEFLANELHRLADQLAKITGKIISDAELITAINLEEHADANLAQVYQNKAQLELTDKQFYQLVRSREYLPNADFNLLCEGLVINSNKETQPEIRLCLSGILAEPLELFDALNQFGARVVCDDLACGARRLYGSGTATDPFMRMAQRLLSTTPEPTRQRSLEARLHHIVTLVKQNSVKAVVVYDVKFCEPELFDLPHLKQALQAEGIPCLHVEFEPEDGLSNQTLTRLEAFLEVLK